MNRRRAFSGSWWKAFIFSTSRLPVILKFFTSEQCVCIITTEQNTVQLNGGQKSKWNSTNFFSPDQQTGFRAVWRINVQMIFHLYSFSFYHLKCCHSISEQHTAWHSERTLSLMIKYNIFSALSFHKWRKTFRISKLLQVFAIVLIILERLLLKNDFRAGSPA